MKSRTAALAAALALVTGSAGLFGQAASGVQAAPAAPAAEKGTPITMTVDQAIQMAMSNQPLIQQAQAAVEAARARVGQAESSYYPNLSAAASYNRLSDESFTIASVLPAGINPAALGVPSSLMPLLTSPLALVPVDNWDFHLGLSQVVFQFGRRGVQVSLARSGVSAALVGVDQVRMSLAYQTAAGFYTVLFMQQQLAALDEQTENLRQHLEATRIKADTGAATRYDELATQVRVSALQSQRIEAENQLRRQEIGLRQILGLKDTDQLALRGDFVSPAPPTEDPSQLLSTALSRRPDMRQAAEAESAADLASRLAGLAAWPTISAHASIGYKNGLLPDINVLGLNWVAGVQVNVPIFQGFLVARQGDEAREKLLAARENTMAIRRNVSTQVMQALGDVQAGRDQVQTSQSQEDQARQMLDMVKLQYDLGMLTNLEYLDAQAAMERAQVGSLQARYREVLSEYALLQATGAPIWTPTPAAAASPAGASAGGR